MRPPTLSLTMGQLIAIQQLKSPMWPSRIVILDASCKIKGKQRAHPRTNEPMTIEAWVESEFRILYSAPLQEIIHAIRIWWLVHDKITNYLLATKSPIDERLIYNATWCLLGYELGQSTPVLNLARKCMLDPIFQKSALVIKYGEEITEYQYLQKVTQPQRPTKKRSNRPTSRRK